MPGRLDILVCSAGTTARVPFADLDGLSEADWDRVFAVNLKGPWFCARAAAPHMRRQGGGRVVNVASVSGRVPLGSSLAYCASKAALIHLTRCLGKALGPDNILVNAICPGLLETRWIGDWTPEMIDVYRQRSPLGRITSVTDAAALAVLLCRTDSMAGEAVGIDAGMML